MLLRHAKRSLYAVDSLCRRYLSLCSTGVKYDMQYTRNNPVPNVRAEFISPVQADTSSYLNALQFDPVSFYDRFYELSESDATRHSSQNVNIPTTFHQATKLERSTVVRNENNNIETENMSSGHHDDGSKHLGKRRSEDYQQDSSKKSKNEIVIEDDLTSSTKDDEIIEVLDSPLKSKSHKKQKRKYSHKERKSSKREEDIVINGDSTESEIQEINFKPASSTKHSHKKSKKSRHRDKKTEENTVLTVQTLDTDVDHDQVSILESNVDNMQPEIEDKLGGDNRNKKQEHKTRSRDNKSAESSDDDIKIISKSESPVQSQSSSRERDLKNNTDDMNKEYSDEEIREIPQIASTSSHRQNEEESSKIRRRRQHSTDSPRYGHRPDGEESSNSMDIPSSPLVGGIYYASELEQQWQEEKLPTDTSSQYDSGSNDWLRNRQWEYTDFGKKWKHNPGRKVHGKEYGVDFTIASYNVLAQNILEEHPYLYDTCERRHLDWTYRSQNLLAEITELQPDILCMQEVYEPHYNDFYKPGLAQLGYKGVYKKRTGDKDDGCATFWKDYKFSLKQSVPVEYFRRGVAVLNRDNVALLVSLIPRVDTDNDNGKQKKASSSNYPLCVANTHLLFNPRRGDVKLAQAMLLMAEIEKLAFTRISGGDAVYCPTILCGDFNCPPFCDLYRFFDRGVLQYQGLWKTAVCGSPVKQYHDWKLSNEIIPKSMGISDNCQYLKDYRKRLNNYKKKTKKRRSPSKDTTVSESDSVEVISIDSPQTPSDASPQGSNTRGTAGNSDVEHCRSPIAESGPSTSRSSTRSQSEEPGCSSQAGAVDDGTDETAPVQCSGTLSHPIKFESVYEHEFYNGRYVEKEVTSFCGNAPQTVDYIFYSVVKKGRRKSRRKHDSHKKEGRLRLIGKMQGVGSSWFEQLGGLPNHAVSSDHVVIMAKFALDCTK